jgi:uncharacterized protein YkwD
LKSIHLLLVACLSIPFAGFTQKPTDSLVLKNLNFQSVESLFIAKLNQHRKEKGLSILGNDPVLKLAAKDQADFMRTKNLLTHNQPTADKASPEKRISYYKGTHDQSGENCIKIYLKRPSKTNYSKAPVTVSTYDQAAQALFLGWKNSPPHYKNMLTPGYEVQGLGFSFNPDSNILYVAQVFAARPYTAPKDINLVSSEYGLKDYDPKICKCMTEPNGETALSTTGLSIEGDSIFLRSENLPELKKLFNKYNDAIFLDIVLREQFPCATFNNNLHGSPIYDGTPLKPVYFPDIFRQNRAHDGLNLYAPLCKVPAYFQNKQYEVNYSFVKEERACDYVWPVQAPSENLPMLPLRPEFLIKKGQPVPPHAFDTDMELYIHYERGVPVMSLREREKLIAAIKDYQPFIRGAVIQTYSSVEGETAQNLSLQQRRGQDILQFVRGISMDLPEVQIESKENWEDFLNGILGTPYAYLAELDHAEIKARLADKNLDPYLEEILFHSRTARLVLSLHIDYHKDSPPVATLAAYKNALQQGDSLTALRCQYILLQNRQLLPQMMRIEVPPIRKFAPVFANFMALAGDPEISYLKDIQRFVANAEKLAPFYKPLRFNLCIADVRYMYEFGDTLIPVAKLERNLLDAAMDAKTPAEKVLVYHLFLNFNILSVYNHWSRHEFHKIDRHLENIKVYYPEAALTESESIHLGLLFNLYMRHRWTTEMLLPFLKKNPNNEHLLFLYVQTSTAMQEMRTGSDWNAWLERARKMNPQRFYNWIDVENFQYLRLPEIKKQFCEIDK